MFTPKDVCTTIQFSIRYSLIAHAREEPIGARASTKPGPVTQGPFAYCLLEGKGVYVITLPPQASPTVGQAWSQKTTRGLPIRRARKRSHNAIKPKYH